MRTNRLQKIVALIGVSTVMLAACGGGGSSSSASAPVVSAKTGEQLSAELAVKMAETTAIAPTMNWTVTTANANAGEILATSTTSMGDVALMVSSVDYTDPTTGQVDTTGYRGTVLYDSRTDDAEGTARSIDAGQLNARFSLKNVNLRSMPSVYVEVFSSTKGLVYQAVIAANEISGKTLAITVE
jgi:hypothetical protein